MDNVYTENDVLKMLSEKYKGSYIKDDILTIPEFDISLKLQIVNTQEFEGNYSAQVVFFVNHPMFDQELVESCAGAGKTANEAIDMCTENFAATVLLSLQSALECDNDKFITAELPDEHIFRVPCVTGTLAIGDNFLEKGDLWALVEDVIPKYLGCKKVYWIKLFAAMTGDDIICEARVNGMLCNGLTEYLRQRLPLNGLKTSYSSYKSFVVLIQKDETYTPCPYTIEQVEELACIAMEMFKNVYDQESHDQKVKEIIESAPVPSLGWEVAGLVPELYCMMVLNLNENDGLMYRCEGSDDIKTVRITQLTGYDYIARVVYGYITHFTPSKEDSMKILMSSGMFRAVNKAVNDGAKLEDLRCSDIMYTVCDDYKIY